LTLVIDDDLLRRARVKALEEGTSVNAVVRAQIEAYASDRGPEIALRSFLDGAKRSKASSGGSGRSWSRDELHDR
jgi:hypothetical protein